LPQLSTLIAQYPYLKDQIIRIFRYLFCLLAVDGQVMIRNFIVAIKSRVRTIHLRYYSSQLLWRSRLGDVLSKRVAVSW